MSIAGPRHLTSTIDRRLELVVSQSVLLGLALVIVGLRLITRFLVVKSPGWDDYAITFAAVCLVSNISLSAQVA